MQGILLLPISILQFWYFEAPVALLSYFWHLNKAFFDLFSFSLMIRTFFRPWKNEYRKEFVKFSIFMGMAFKTILIFVDLFLFVFLLLFEVVVFTAFLAWPLLTFYLPFVRL